MLEQKAIEIIDKLAQKIGVASGKIWEWALLDVKTDIVELSIFVSLCFAATYGAYRMVKHLTNDDCFDWYDLPGIWVIVLCVSVGLLDIAGAISLIGIPAMIINPEYAAFEKIMTMISTMK